jgi:catechol 2,3-dioxygenase-like lactoylglutathione lyase family enzyme
MKVEAIDHVNIRTPDVVGTSRFLSEVLGLEIGDTPGMPDRTKACWMHDSGGRAVIHLGTAAIGYPWESNPQAAAPGSGRIHHVALRCNGYESMCDRLRSQGRSFHSNDVTQIALRQLFIEEPNGILLELNFFGD